MGFTRHKSTGTMQFDCDFSNESNRNANKNASNRKTNNVKVKMDSKAAPESHPLRTASSQENFFKWSKRRPRHGNGWAWLEKQQDQLKFLAIAKQQKLNNLNGGGCDAGFDEKINNTDGECFSVESVQFAGNGTRFATANNDKPANLERREGKVEVTQQKQENRANAEECRSTNTKISSSFELSDNAHSMICDKLNNYDANCIKSNYLNDDGDGGRDKQDQRTIAGGDSTMEDTNGAKLMSLHHHHHPHDRIEMHRGEKVEQIGVGAEDKGRRGDEKGGQAETSEVADGSLISSFCNREKLSQSADRARLSGDARRQLRGDDVTMNRNANGNGHKDNNSAQLCDTANGHDNHDPSQLASSSDPMAGLQPASMAAAAAAAAARLQPSMPLPLNGNEPSNGYYICAQTEAAIRTTETGQMQAEPHGQTAEHINQPNGNDNDKSRLGLPGAGQSLRQPRRQAIESQLQALQKQLQNEQDQDQENRHQRSAVLPKLSKQKCSIAKSNNIDARQRAETRPDNKQAASEHNNSNASARPGTCINEQKDFGIGPNMVASIDKNSGNSLKATAAMATNSPGQVRANLRMQERPVETTLKSGNEKCSTRTAINAYASASANQLRMVEIISKITSPQSRPNDNNGHSNAGNKTISIKQQVEQNKSNAGAGILRQQSKSSSIQSRLPRTLARSPISLRTQTNAKLQKHRLKIQQQRQEQLSKLISSSPSRSQLGQPSKLPPRPSSSSGVSEDSVSGVNFIESLGHRGVETRARNSRNNEQQLNIKPKSWTEIEINSSCNSPGTNTKTRCLRIERAKLNNCNTNTLNCNNLESVQQVLRDGVARPEFTVVNLAGPTAFRLGLEGAEGADGLIGFNRVQSGNIPLHRGNFFDTKLSNTNNPQNKSASADSTSNSAGSLKNQYNLNQQKLALISDRQCKQSACRSQQASNSASTGRRSDSYSTTSVTPSASVSHSGHVIDLTPLNELLRESPINIVSARSNFHQPTTMTTKNKVSNQERDYNHASQNYLLMAKSNGCRSKLHGDQHRANQMVANNCFDDIETEDNFDARTTCSTSSSSTSLNRPFCKICHMGASSQSIASIDNHLKEKNNGESIDDKLISPCKCSGTMQYIHCGCLLKWLEISNRSNEKPISCELCGHEYTWHKKFNYANIKLPKCSWTDIIYHTIFICTIFAMLFAALAPMLNPKSKLSTAQTSLPDKNDPSSPQSSLQLSSANNDKHQAINSRNNDNNHRMQYNHLGHHHHPFGNIATNNLATGKLAQDEKFMLICAAIFFISFFLAIYVQTKARHTLYGLCCKFLSANQTYYITEYDHGQNNHHLQQQQQQQQRQARQRNNSIKNNATSINNNHNKANHVNNNMMNSNSHPRRNQDTINNLHINTRVSNNINTNHDATRLLDSDEPISNNNNNRLTISHNSNNNNINTGIHPNGVSLKQRLDCQLLPTTTGDVTTINANQCINVSHANILGDNRNMTDNTSGINSSSNVPQLSHVAEIQLHHQSNRPNNDNDD